LYTDALMMPKKDLGAGLFYSHDQWTKYWEGTLKRENGNIGTLSTQSATWMGAYGLTNKVTLIATVPYVWTKATGGTLHSMQGIQDLTVAAKYNFFAAEVGRNSFKLFGMFAFSTPLSNYSKDFLPLSIGLGSTNLSYRLTGHYAFDEKWFVTLSGAYTWRSNVYLDRPSYYTNGQLYYTDEVKMPNTLDGIARMGYHKGSLRTEVYYTVQRTLGGGDIRRQDMPFVSNQMNFMKVGASIMFVSPHLKYIALRAWGNYTLAGRNVGQSTTLTLGAMYFIHFSKEQ
jgi:hypothetical protein